MNITFLLGAGASIPAGYSSTECLTDKVLASEGYFRHTDGNFYTGCIPEGLDYMGLPFFKWEKAEKEGKRSV